MKPDTAPSVGKDLDARERRAVQDVAEYILFRVGRMTAMKLQKLVYYTQAWSLAWDDQPLFLDVLEAWANGPVAPALYELHRAEFWVLSVGGDHSLLNRRQRQVVDAVLLTYGGLSPETLIELTHQEDPWRAARAGVEPGSRSNAIIGWRSLRDFYRTTEIDVEAL